MTIIGAKQIKGKRNLFSDDVTSLGDYEVSSADNYRRKIRIIPRALHETYVASSGTCRQTDLVINNIDKVYSKISQEDYKILDAYGMKDLLQEAVVEAVRVLKEIDEDNPNFILLILDTTLNEVFLVETFSVIILEPHVEYTGGSGDVFFYSIHSTPSILNDEDKFVQDFRVAAKSAPGCGGKVFQVSEGDVKVYPELQ